MVAKTNAAKDPRVQGSGRRALRLAAKLAAEQSKYALALSVAEKAVASGLVQGRTPEQVEADLLAELGRCEKISTLLQIGRGRSKPWVIL